MVISFKFKLMAAMVLAVMLVTLASFSLIRKQVAWHFEEALFKQYGRQFEIFQKREAERLQAFSGEIINSTSNPRLLAALVEDDFSRFYYDLAQELKAFYQNIENQYASGELWPFFRFIRQDGAYLKPPAAGEVAIDEAVDSLPGILSPFEEEAVRELLTGLRTRDDEVPAARSGFLVVDQEGGKVLLKAFVCPVVDAFGFFMGDLIVVVPWRDAGGEAANVRSAVIVDGTVFGAGGEAGAGGWIELGLNPGPESTATATKELELGGEAYLLFSRRLSADGRFPPAEQAALFSLEEQRALMGSITRILILIAVVGFAVSLFLSMGLAQGLHAPIERLKRASLKLGKGDFKARVEVRGRDEIGQLSVAFNEMAEGLETKERYKAVLSKVTDAKVAEKLMGGEIDMGGESVKATVLFCDIRGFTGMSEGMDPHLLISILNEHMTAMTEVVYAHGGVVDKFVGDELMVLFGVPVPLGDDVGRAFDCALAMIRRCREMNEGRERTIEIGIGMAHGEMVAGCMGSEDRLNYTVLGDRVNLASRLCSKAAPMEIVVDQPIRDYVGKAFDGAERKTMPLKGFKTAPPFFVMKTR